MAINIKSNNASKAKSRLFGIFLALAVIVIISIMTAISSAENKKTIKVARIKEGTGISANSLITKNMLEEYDMYYKEFKNYGTLTTSSGQTYSNIVRWSDVDAVFGKRYAAYYMRGGTVLFWDATLADQTRKNSYLYSMSGELLNINLTTTQDFGDMVVPGDTLNVRATYIDTVYNLPTEEEYKEGLDAGVSVAQGTQREVTELMFSEVKILDMLNASGSSIFDVYYEYIAMTKEQQAAALEDKNFIQKVTPQSILLEVTSEEVERFLYLRSKGATYHMTLLPRKSSSAITDSLSDIQEALAGIAGLNQ